MTLMSSSLRRSNNTNLSTSSTTTNAPPSGAASVASSLTVGTKETERFAALAEEALRNETILMSNSSVNGHHHDSFSRCPRSSRSQLQQLQGDNNIPFVGRETEMEALNGALDALFDRTAPDTTQQATSSVICVTAPAGTGKSHLIRQLRASVLDRDGYFLRGKFSSTNGTAYSGLAMALQDLVDQILHRDLDMGIRRRLEENIQPQDAAVLLEIFSTLSSVLFVGEEDSVDQCQSSSSFFKSGSLTLSNKANNSSGNTQRAKQRQFLFLQFIRVLQSSHTYQDEDIVHMDEPDQEDAAAEQPATPIVLVLDDVQWMDPPSCDLISALVRDQHSQTHQPFLLIATSRVDTEDPKDQDYLFGKEMNLWQEQHISTQHIRLQNLSSDDIHTILASFLGIPLSGAITITTDSTSLDGSTSKSGSASGGDSTQALADIIHEKTKGNAFFVIEFIKSLLEQELLTYNYGSLAWKWDVRKVKSMVLCSDGDNAVVDLLTSKLHNQLSPSQRFALLVATCLGGTFDQALMERILHHLDAADFMDSVRRRNSHKTSKEVLRHLVDLGFLNQSISSSHDDDDTGGHLYFFSHDLIQQAAGDLMTADMSPEKGYLLKYRIGECILHNVGGGGGSKEQSRQMERRGRELFLGVDLCNDAASHVAWIDRLKLARYNLLAGESAMSESAFAAALRYMEAGLKLLDETLMQEHKHLYEDLLAGAAEAHYCAGSYMDMGAYAEQILQGDGCREEIILRMLYLNVLSSMALHRFQECLDIGATATNRLGMTKISSKVNKLHVLREFLKTKRLLRDHTPETLRELPLMDPIAQEKRITTMKFFDALDAAGYAANKNFIMVMGMISLRWTVKYGISRFSPNGFALYGLLQMALFGDIQAATMFGEVAIAMSERVGLSEPKAKVSMLVFPFLHHWTNNMRTGIPPLAYAYRLAMECGNTETAIMTCWYMDKINWGTGLPLHILAGDLQRHCCALLESDHGPILGATTHLAEQLRRLCSDDTEFRWLDDCKAGRIARENLVANNRSRMIQIFIATVNLATHLLLKEHDEALKLAKTVSTKDAAKELVGQTYLPHLLFSRGLVFLAFAGDGKDTRHNLREVNLILKIMTTWRSKGNPNVLHMICLMEAEVAKIQNRHDEAKELYAEAVQLANRSGHIHDAGICHESAGVYYLGITQRPRAAHHIQQAIKCFNDWGASAVVDRLLATYKDLTSMFTSVVVPTLHKKSTKCYPSSVANVPNPVRFVAPKEKVMYDGDTSNETVQYDAVEEC